MISHRNGITSVYRMDWIVSLPHYVGLKKIEIVGNVVSDEQYKGPIPTTDDYENYYWNHNLNTKQYKFSDE